MHASARHLALAASLVLAGSVVHAAPGQVASRHGKKNKGKRPATVAPPATAPVATRRTDDAPGNDDTPSIQDDADSRADAPRIALGSTDAGSDLAKPSSPRDDTVKLAKLAGAAEHDWHITIGPYLWASAVDANVSLGSSSVGTGVDFVPLERHARYGAEILAEVRRGRFVISGDLMYGAVALTGAAGIGPVMTTLTGNASSLLIDGAAGYAIAGDERSPLSLELRGGVRYQRTTVNGELDLAGYSLQTPEAVAAGSDALIGARGFVRPWSWFYLSGVFDVGVFGASNTTWSASIDASLRVTSHMVFSLGWRTLTLDRDQVSIVLHGPRAAFQLVF